MDKQTSDERLLKLIEGSTESKRKQFIGSGEKKISTGKTSKFNLFDLKSRLKSLKISLFSINKGLIGLAALLTLIFLYTIFNAPQVSKSNAAFYNPADASVIMKLISGKDNQGLARQSILSQDIKRNFFLPPGIRGTVYTQESSQDSTEEIKDLKLVGIIWSKEPEVMIEDAKDSRTYTLKKGESLNGQFKVKKVSRNSATLEMITQDGPKEYEIR